MSTPDPCPPGLMERFGAFITRLKQAVADGSGRNKALMGPLTLLLWRYLSRTLERLTRLHAKFLAGTLPAPRPAETLASPHPRPSSERWAAQGTASEKPRIPAGHVFMPFFVAHLYHAMRQLIEDPEMLALLAAAPQAGRILRPLWRRMTADPLPEVLRLPKRPRRSRRQSEPAEPGPEPGQAAPAAPPKPPREAPSRPRRRRQAAPDEERAVWVWHPPPLKSA